MARVVSLKQASTETGLSYPELYSGVRSGKYPGFQVGTSKHGKWVVDVDLLNARIKELMLQNVDQSQEEPEVIQYGTLRRARG